MAKQNYNLNFSEAQDYITKRGLDVVWNDCDIFIDEHHITESVANVLKWADENPKPNLVDIDKAVEWLKIHMPFGEVDLNYRNTIIEDFKQAMMEE